MASITILDLGTKSPVLKGQGDVCEGGREVGRGSREGKRRGEGQRDGQQAESRVEWVGKEMRRAGRRAAGSLFHR